MDGDERLKPPDKGGGECECLMETEGFKASADICRKRTGDNLSSEPLPKRTITDPESGLGSESNIYKHPSLEVNCRKYDVDDFGPFIVHVSRIADSPNSGVSLKPIRLGAFLVEGGVQSVKKDGIKQVGRNRLSVEFSSATAANEFLSHELLNKHKLKAEIPSYNISRLGLVRGVPTDWSMEEFVNATEYKEGHGKIMKARRLNRKIRRDDGSPAWLPTQSVVLTFEGQSLPKKIYAFYTSLVVEVYQLPTIQCRKCLRFGHVQNACRSNARCYKCGQAHSGDTCNIPSERVRCLLCTGRHLATDPTCPEFDRQKRIKKIMSENCVSYMEASAQEPVPNPYSRTSPEI
uniref:CCHC-type domain-containing protein n=1 Tax=Heliothis virescens TaxID=7102 RepID=A0A2A4J8C1_HELVI